MRDSPWAPVPVDLSVRLYNWLLAVYPGRFRAEYGYHMAQVFRDVCRRDYRRGGAGGMASLWARTSLDLIRTTVEEHIERGIHMDREKFVRWSGWALMAGAILFTAGLLFSLGMTDNTITQAEGIFEVGTFSGLALGQILFVIGLLGLRAGYAGAKDELGGVVLVMAILGSVVSFAGMVVMGTASSPDAGWNAWYIGFLTMSLGLAAYGVLAIRHHLFSRWNFAPLLAGSVFPIVFVVELAKGSFVDWLYLLGLGVFIVPLFLIGYRMQADVSTTSEAAV